jgi:TusE/DsrC/DsvC family sulfur relay protein
MSTIIDRGRSIEVNEEGFLLHPESWDRTVAEILAKDQEGIDALSDEHWAIVRCIRDHYQTKGNAPMVRVLCKEAQVPLRRIYELFPSGPAKGACKVAGLPKPDGCV